MRTCSVCGGTKPLTEFTPKPKPGQYDSYCKTCRSAYGKRHYAKNRQRYIDNAAYYSERRLKRNTRYLVTFLRKHPCVDCGETDPIVLEFDHLRDKSFNISKKMRESDWPAIAAEIEKCEVVCANCHRRRTARRGGFARLAALEPCCKPARSDRVTRLIWTALRSSLRE